MADNKQHVVVAHPDTNSRESYDIQDSGIGGVGSNWVTISDPHHTDQSVPKSSARRHSGYQQKSHDVYGDG